MRVFIIAKTYPELSSKYGETVCTAAIDELGRPLRLYPIPFRYLSGPQRFRRYQWIEAEISKSPHDARPESHTVIANSIVLHEQVSATSDEWGRRADIVLKSSLWQLSSMRQLQQGQRTVGTSLCFMRPFKIIAVDVHKRGIEDAKTFQEKLEDLKLRNVISRSQLDLFESTIPPAMKSLEYLGERVCVEWLCSDDDCDGHTMQVLDWEICELARRDGLQAALNKVKMLLDSDQYKTAFILGNFHMYPQSFAIIGLWYPLRNDRLF